MPVTVLTLGAALSPSKERGGAMQSGDQKKQARTIVSRRLRSFFSQLQEQLAASTDALWKRVEMKLNDGKKDP
jgi:hypothetical protein